MTPHFDLTTLAENCIDVVEEDTQENGTRGSCAGAPTSVQLAAPHPGFASKVVSSYVNENMLLQRQSGRH
eukprot:13719202-Heterocapsa_arctica.AAC.1